jgi:hypothetical protein
MMQTKFRPRKLRMQKIECATTNKKMGGYRGLAQNRQNYQPKIARPVLLFFLGKRRKKNVKRVNPRGFRDKLLRSHHTTHKSILKI